MSWTEVELGTWAPLTYGKALPEPTREPGSVPVYSSAGLTGYHSTALVESPAVVVGRKGNVGTVFYVDSPFFPIDTAFYTQGSRNADLRFVAYKLQSLRLGQHTRDSAVPGLRRDDYSALRTLVPSLPEQGAIAEVLAALDNKIAANSALSAALRSLARAQYRARLERGKQTLPLEGVATFHNRRRVPLSARERELRHGSVPYYGATSVFGHVDAALFDEILVLVGEDGSVVRSDGGPVTQYIWGPSWVNNHAHVLTGSIVSTELLWLALDDARVGDVVTGAVQPKLSMRSLKSVELSVPVAEERDAAAAEADTVLAHYRAVVGESAQLAALRDALLPELMSGRLRVKDAERAVEGAV